MTTLAEEPHSPSNCNSRTLKGESIRSLRELFQSSVSFSHLPEDKGNKENDNDNNDNDQQLLSQKEPEPGQEVDDTTTNKTGENAVPSKQLPVRHVDEVRGRFLQNLGIPNKVGPSTTLAAANPPPSTMVKQVEPSYTTTLNDDWEYATYAHLESTNNAESTLPQQQDDDKEEDPTIPTTTTTGNRKILLHFDPTVTVHPIPSHKVYSQRIKQTIWAGAGELAENVARNVLEFSAENWDAAQVLDEETGLIYCPRQQEQGEWIHPVHLDKNWTNEEPLASDQIWQQTCARLGIQPAEYYHSLELPKAAAASSRKK